MFHFAESGFPLTEKKMLMGFSLIENLIGFCKTCARDEVHFIKNLGMLLWVIVIFEIKQTIEV